MKKYLIFLLIVACDNIKSEIVGQKVYPEPENQPIKLAGYKLLKEVSLEGTREMKELEMDSALWGKELSFLEEINPNRPEYAGVFIENTDGGNLKLVLGEGERGSLQQVNYELLNNEIQKISAVIYEEKGIYVHSKNIEVKLSEGRITDFLIQGYQKIIFKDTISFWIEGRIRKQEKGTTHK